MSVHGAAGGSQRKALARTRSAAALDSHRTLGSREEVPTHQRLSSNLVAEGTPESVAPSAEGGPDSRSCLNLVVSRPTVQNIESRCNQLKLGHPPRFRPAVECVETYPPTSAKSIAHKRGWSKPFGGIVLEHWARIAARQPSAKKLKGKRQ